VGTHGSSDVDQWQAMAHIRGLSVGRWLERGGVGPLVTSLNKSPVRSRGIGPLVNWQLIGRRPLCIGQLPTYIGMCTTDACGTSLLVE
jgi:hypothetical protein